MPGYEYVFSQGMMRLRHRYSGLGPAGQKRASDFVEAAVAKFQFCRWQRWGGSREHEHVLQCLAYEGTITANSTQITFFCRLEAIHPLHLSGRSLPKRLVGVMATICRCFLLGAKRPLDPLSLLAIQTSRNKILSQKHIFVSCPFPSLRKTPLQMNEHNLFMSSPCSFDLKILRHLLGYTSQWTAFLLPPRFQIAPKTYEL